MKRKIQACLMACAIASASSVYAEDGLKTNISGVFKFESAFRNQNHIPADSKNLSAHNKKVGFFTDAAISGVASKTVDGFTYGARVALQTTTHRSGTTYTNGSYLFTECDYGKFQFGSAYDASSIMRVTALDIARGTGDDWTNFVWTDPNMAILNTASASFLDVQFTGNRIETSRKITYFSPKFADAIELGISYIPDTNNAGIGKINDSTSNTRKVTAANGSIYEEKPGAKNAVGLAAVVTHNFADSVDLKLALTSEHGTSASKGQIKDAAGNAVLGEYKIANLKAYNVGAIFNYGPVSFAGSYMDKGKSFTSVELDGSKRSGKVYTVGAAYNQGPVGVSLVYMMGKTGGNRMSSYTLGTDYKLAPGFVPFVELTYFEGKGKKYAVTTDPTTTLKSKGTIALIGAKLKF